MPMLFYGTTGKFKRPRLHGANLRLLETSVFDSYAIDNLAPYSRKPNVALFWHFSKRNHSAFAWHNEQGIEQVAFVPGLLTQLQMFELLRVDFAEVMPSSLLFRISNEHEPYDYD